MLSFQDRAALSAGDKQLRRVIHSSVTAITVHEVSDAKAVMMGEWPQLALIKLRPSAPIAVWRYIRLAQHSKFQLLASLLFSTSRVHPYESKTALVVTPAVQLNQHRSIAAAFSLLQGPKWQRFSHLLATVHSQAEDIMTHMAQSDWPGFEQLDFRHSTLSPTAFHQLGKGSWSGLHTLDLCDNPLSEAAIAALVQGNWPMLTKLALVPSPFIVAAKMPGIPTAAKWPSLASLNLVRMKLNTACVHGIALLHDQLRELDLSYTDIGAAALSQIASSPWPHLQRLGLAGNRLQANAIASLVAAHMPTLTSLRLQRNKLDAAAARHLATGAWLKLSALILDNNYLDNAAMGLLAHGSWPSLQTLLLEGNNIGAQGLQALMAGQWPMLSCLTLDAHVSAASGALLNLACCAPPCGLLPHNFRTSRGVAGVGDDVVWPKLAEVRFTLRSPQSLVSWSSCLKFVCCSTLACLGMWLIKCQLHQELTRLSVGCYVYLGANSV